MDLNNCIQKILIKQRGVCLAILFGTLARWQALDVLANLRLES